jgi:hypothetical protein
MKWWCNGAKKNLTTKGTSFRILFFFYYFFFFDEGKKDVSIYLKILMKNRDEPSLQWLNGLA